MKLFKRKRKKKISMELPVHKYNELNNYHGPTKTAIQSDNKMARLMELIGHAMEEWAVEYNLENMPKKIIFEQALDAMRAIELTINNKEY